MVDTLDPGQACPGIPTTWKRREEKRGMYSLLAIKLLTYVSRGNRGEWNIRGLRMVSSQTG